MKVFAVCFLIAVIAFEAIECQKIKTPPVIVSRPPPRLPVETIRLSDSRESNTTINKVDVDDSPNLVLPEESSSTLSFTIEDVPSEQEPVPPMIRCVPIEVTPIGAWGHMQANLPTELQLKLNDSCLIELGKQMNLQKQASIAYEQMSAYFSNIRLARKGFAKLFSVQSQKKHRNFQKLMNYIIFRGSAVPVFKIEMPGSKWFHVDHALQQAFELESKIYDELIQNHKIADKTCKDLHMMRFLENEFIGDVATTITKLRKLKTMVLESGYGNGKYMINRDLANGAIKLEEL